jgi:hypothetical protein
MYSTKYISFDRAKARGYSNFLPTRQDQKKGVEASRRAALLLTRARRRGLGNMRETLMQPASLMVCDAVFQRRHNQWMNT